MKLQTVEYRSPVTGQIDTLQPEDESHTAARLAQVEIDNRPWWGENDRKRNSPRSLICCHVILPLDNLLER